MRTIPGFCRISRPVMSDRWRLQRVAKQMFARRIQGALRRAIARRRIHNVQTDVRRRSLRTYPSRFGLGSGAVRRLFR